MSNSKIVIGSVAIATCLAAVPASAAVVVLDFENIAPYPNNNDVLIQGFYNGGTSSIGTSGTNFGVDLSANALLICLNTPGVNCSNASRGGLGNPNSQEGSLFFLSGTAATINVAAGFDTGFSFFYTAINETGSVEVYDGLDGTGNLLETLNLPLTASNCDLVLFCPFEPVGVGFNGTARSVSFVGGANQIAIDDVTFGSVIPDPDPVPEPLTLLGASAAIAFGAAFKHRKAQ